MAKAAGQRTRETMIATVERYFAAVDNGDVPGTLATMTPGCTLSVVTDHITHTGRDREIKAMFERRLDGVQTAWHGDFRHLADPEKGWVTSRFDVRRTNADGSKASLDNINFFEFEGDLIHRISIWMSGVNTLR